ALKIDPENPDLRLKHAEMYMEIGNPQKAVKHLEFIERRQGESPELLLQKATAYEMMDRYRLARKMVDRAYELAPSNPVVRRRYLIELGEDASEAVYDEDLDRALEICLKQLSIDPEYLPAAHRLTALYFYSGQKQKAKETIARVIEWEPDGAQNHVIAGRLYLEFEFKQEAKKAFARALEIDGSEDCLIRIGESYLATKSLKKALSYFESAVKSGSFDTFMKIASTLHEYDYDREAEKYIDRASEKDPSHPEPHLVKAVLLINRNKIEDAYEEMDEAERLAAERPEAEEISERVRSLMRSIERRKKLMEMIEEIGGSVRDMPPEIRRLFLEMMED
ncbi:MAG: tetratricopeptide repeat protein, partial [Blastocatellia bacterium]|nr:tetratricopeptide repeat protein [Blastocatellia bacterium]